jgi:hypothetical protein
MLRRTKTNQNLQASSNLGGGQSTKLKNKISGEDDSVQNFELSCFHHDYVLAFREINKRQKVRKQLIKEWEYKLSILMCAASTHR